jgi:non-specific serine/threonine protein kinase
MEEVASSLGQDRPSPDSLRLLTPREREVALLLADGLTNRDIAHRLVIAVSTVERHVANILGKLGLSSRTRVATVVVKQRVLAGIAQ